jgi:hypothetical protein
LGYTCCSDIDDLPEVEWKNLKSKNKKNYFNAYVNIGSLDRWPIQDIIELYPNASFIYTARTSDEVSLIDSAKFLYLPNDYSDKWEWLCSLLKCEYPSSPYPVCNEIGQRNIMKNTTNRDASTYKQLKYDKSPWIVKFDNWQGIATNKPCDIRYLKCNHILKWFGKKSYDNINWKMRNDTFPSNLSIFNPDNVEIDNLGLTHLNLKEQQSSVRSFSSAAIATRNKYLYGKFSIEPVFPNKL